VATFTPKQLALGTAVSTPAIGTVYTVPALTTTILSAIAAVNTTASSMTITVQLNGTAYLKDVPLAANTTQFVTAPMVLTAGQTLQASASAAGAVIQVSGTESV